MFLMAFEYVSLSSDKSSLTILILWIILNQFLSYDGFFQFHQQGDVS